MKVLVIVALILSVDAYGIEVQFLESDDYTFSSEDKKAIQIAAESIETDVRQLLPQLDEDLVLEVRNGSEVIPETGETGAALAPGKISWTVDPARPEGVAMIAESHLRSTLFHEIHHLVRGWNDEVVDLNTPLIERIVSEGMATVFARDFTNAQTPWADYPDNVEEWAREILALPASATTGWASVGRWMFYHPDGRRWIGYKVGAYIVDQAMKSSGKSSAELVNVPAEEIVRLAGLETTQK